jgi:hypothetical protein
MGMSTSPRAPFAAWGLFFAFGVLLCVHAVYLMALPSAEPDHWKAYTTDPEVVSYLTDEFRASGAMQFGFAALTMVASARWFRQGDRWAWYVFWIYPLVFGWQMATSWATGLWLVVLGASLAGLLGPFRTFFPRRSGRVGSPAP